MIESLLTVNLLRLPDAVLARQRARSFAAALDLSRAAQAQLAVAVAEIARNALQHGSGGEVRFALDREGRALIVEISDDGPGIDDLAHQLEVGRSLRGAKLLVDEMTIETSPAGTVVRLRKDCTAQPLPSEAQLSRRVAAIHGAEASPYEELRRQNRDLIATIAALQESERKLLLASREREQAAERRAELERQLVGIVSHDLKSPLSAVRFAVEMLADTCSDDKQRRIVGELDSASERAMQLIFDLLDFTRARLGGGIPIRRAPADLHELTARLVSEHAARARLARVEHQRSGDGRGEIDAARFEQIVSNLLDNALRFAKPASVVTVTTRGDGETLSLTVHNEGEPIPDALLPRLFEPLTFAEAPDSALSGGAARRTSASSNIGLGLFIVERIVAAHAGTLEVTSTAAAGTRFVVTVPVHAPAALAVEDGS